VLQATQCHWLALKFCHRIFKPPSPLHQLSWGIVIIQVIIDTTNLNSSVCSQYKYSYQWNRMKQTPAQTQYFFISDHITYYDRTFYILREISNRTKIHPDRSWLYLANKQKETNPINLAGSLPIPQKPTSHYGSAKKQWLDRRFRKPNRTEIKI